MTFSVQAEDWKSAEALFLRRTLCEHCGRNTGYDDDGDADSRGGSNGFGKEDEPEHCGKDNG